MADDYSSHAMPSNPVVAVCGATGAVGQEMLKTLEQRAFPASRVIALASARSAGKRIPYAGPGAEPDGMLTVHEMTNESFNGVDIALFSAGGSISARFAPAVVDAGCVMIDNSSQFRMDEDVPLVVPEVNPEDVARHHGIIANPNCSTIQMVVALKPLAQLCPLKRVIVDTYQAASGAGAAGMNELYNQTRDFLEDKPCEPDAFVHRIAFNCIPHIDVLLDDGVMKEEWKMIVETQKIMHAPQLALQATCVRVPVLRCHSEAVHVEFEDSVSLDAVRAAFAAAPGVVVMDAPEKNEYPMPGFLAGTDETYVGRIRRDNSLPDDRGISFWVVADQLRKGAALNAVQIAEMLLP